MAEFEQVASCRLVCRPNRRRIRTFTAKDIKRISRYAVDDGVDPVEILIGVLVATGLAVFICKIANGIRFIVAVRESLESIAVIIAGSTLLNFFIKSVGGRLIKVLPIVRLITIVAAIQELFFNLVGESGSDDLENFIVASDFINDLCDRVRRAV